MPVQVGARLVHIDTIASSAARALPGEPLPDWADEPTDGEQVPAQATVRNWTGRHLMVLFTLKKSRPATDDAPAVAVAVTLGSLYEIAFAPAEPDPAPDGHLLAVLSERNLEAVIQLALRDTAPFARQAVHAASASVVPTSPILLTGLDPSALAVHPAGLLDDDET